MAGRTSQIKTTDELIAEITRVQDELARLDIRRERFNFKIFTFGMLEDLLEDLSDQLDRRKKFLAGVTYGKN